MQTMTPPISQPQTDRLLLATELKVCKRCLYLIKLKILEDEDKFYIGQACECGPVSRLSDYYTVRSEASTDLASFSWRS